VFAPGAISFVSGVRRRFKVSLREIVSSITRDLRRVTPEVACLGSVGGGANAGPSGVAASVAVKDFFNVDDD
jgi:hypothetical protein